MPGGYSSRYQNYTPAYNYAPASGYYPTGEKYVYTPSRRGGGTFGGRSVSKTSFVPASFVDPRIERQNQLVGQRDVLDSERAVIDAKTAALNRAVNLQAKGIPIPSDTYAALGISPGQGLVVARARIQEERNQFNQKTQSYNKEAQEFNVELAKPTSAEITARASLLDRGERVQIVQSAVARGGIPTRAAAATLALPQKGSLPEKFGGTAAVVVPGEKNIFEDIGVVLAGRPGTEQKGIPFTGTGGVFERTQKAFYGSIRGGSEFGERVGGAPGKVVGAFGGAAVGSFFGIFEGSLTTVGLVFYEKPVTRLVSGQFNEPVTDQGAIAAGQVSGTLFSFLSSPTVLMGAAQKLGKGGLTATKLLPQTLLKAESFAQRGKSVYAGETIFGRAATQTWNLIQGFEGGLSGVGVSALYGGQAVRVVAGVGGVLRGGARAVQQPLVKYPLTFGLAPVAPLVFGGLAGVGESEEYRRVIQTPVGSVGRERGFEKVRAMQAGEGFFAQVGGELGLGFYGDEKSKVGGVSAGRVQQAFKEGFIEAGASPEQAERLAVAQTRVYKAQQAGGIVGQIGISIGTELSGTSTISPIIYRGLIGQVVGLSGKEAGKKAGKLTGQTLTRFAGFGAIEGAGSTVISDFTQSRQLSPLKTGFGALAGAVSAPLLGGLTIYGATYRAFRGGKSVFGAGTEKGALSAGYITDVFEKAGDDLARLFGKTEPRFRIRTVQGVPSLTQTSEVEGRRGGGKTAISTFFRTPVGVQTPVSTDIPTYTPTKQPTPIPFQDFIGQPERGPDTFQQNINENFQQNINQTFPVGTPINFNVPVGVPVSKAGFPPFFPAMPFGEGGRGGRGRERKTYLNEFAFATGLLGQGLLKRGKTISRERRGLFGSKRKKQRRSKRGNKR